MKFEELWEDMRKCQLLPEAAIENIPSLLKESTKEKLKKIDPYGVCNILKDAINEIEAGSVDSLNSIVLKKLSN